MKRFLSIISAVFAILLLSFILLNAIDFHKGNKVKIVDKQQIFDITPEPNKILPPHP